MFNHNFCYRSTPRDNWVMEIHIVYSVEMQSSNDDNSINIYRPVNILRFWDVFETSITYKNVSKSCLRRVYVKILSRLCVRREHSCTCNRTFLLFFFKSQIYIRRKFKKSLNIYFVVNKILSYAFCIYFLQITHRQKCNLEFLLVLCMKTKLAL